MNEAKARKALQIRNQRIAWVKWNRGKRTKPEPQYIHPDKAHHANCVLAAFAAEILERNP